MTREDAIKVLNMVEAHGLADEAKRMAIKALEHPEQNVIAVVPCGDCISRQAVLDGLASIAKAKAKSDAQKSLMGRVMFFTERLPSVNPQEPKTGHWITVTNGRGGHECSLCHEYAPSYQSGDEWLTKYCPGCGCRMFEPQESEDNEDIPIEYFESGGC